MNTRLSRLATCCLLTGALALDAQADPQQQQSQQGGTTRRFDHERPPGGGPGGPGFGPGFGRGGGGFDPNSDEYKLFKEQLKAFCIQHSPRRWQEVEDRIQRARGGFQRQMSLKFRELQSLENTDPALHAIKVRLIEVEDVEYGLTADLKLANIDKVEPAKIAEIRARLREQNEKYVRLRFEERSHRIDRLARLLEDEKRKLADDRKGSDRLVDDRLAELEKQGTDFFFIPRGPRRPDGENPSTAPTTAPAPAAAPAPPR